MANGTATILQQNATPKFWSERLRARFAVDPVPLALAMAMSVRDPTTEVRPGVRTPRSPATVWGFRE